MSGNTLVTGGAGFIGSHLVDALIARRQSVTVLDDFSTGSMANLDHAAASGRLTVVNGSVLDEDAVRSSLEDCDAVYHLAVQCVRRSIGLPRESHDVNATGTLTVLEAARQRGVERFIYCSSSEVYGNGSAETLDEETSPLRPTTVYGAAKLAGELYADAYRTTYGLPTTIVRPFNAYGPRAHVRGVRAEVLPRFVIRCLNGRSPVIFGDGSHARDMTYVTDVARGIATAGQSDRCVGQRINIAFGRRITMRELAEAVMRTTGRNDLGIEYADPRPGDVETLEASTRRAAEQLNYRAEIDFDRGLDMFMQWFRSTYPDPTRLLEPEVRNWVMPETRAGPSS